MSTDNWQTVLNKKKYEELETLYKRELNIFLFNYPLKFGKVIKLRNSSTIGDLLYLTFINWPSYTWPSYTPFFYFTQPSYTGLTPT